MKSTKLKIAFDIKWSMINVFVESWLVINKKLNIFKKKNDKNLIYNKC
jgi:hypothetical protein